MFVLVLAIVLALVSLLAFPCWSYSARWGYLPSAVVGALLFGVALVAIGGRSASRPAEPAPDRVATPAVVPSDPGKELASR